MTDTETITPERDVVPPGGDPPPPQLPAEGGKLFDRAGQIEASIGGLRLESLAQVMDVAKLMSQAATAVPEHCRGNAGICFALCLQALEWKMSPFAVANKSYVVNDRLNYESQLVHAVIEARAPLRERLRVRYEGEGEDAVCVVSGWFRGEVGPREHRSPPLRTARPPIKDGKRKGSPLWDKKPLVQLFYDTCRDFCRIYCPDVLMGIYTPDEVEQYGIGEEARDVTGEVDAAAELHKRLAATAQNGQGFREGVVEAGLGEVASPPRHLSDDEALALRNRLSGQTGNGGPAEAQDAPGAAGGSQLAAEPKKRATGRATGKPKPPRTGKQAEEAPTDADGYLVYFAAWLAATEDAEEVETRWKNEWQLRKACGVGGGEAGTQLLRQKNVRVKALSRAELME